MHASICYTAHRDAVSWESCRKSRLTLGESPAYTLDWSPGLTHRDRQPFTLMDDSEHPINLTACF